MFMYPEVSEREAMTPKAQDEDYVPMRKMSGSRAPTTPSRTDVPIHRKSKNYADSLVPRPEKVKHLSDSGLSGREASKPAPNGSSGSDTFLIVPDPTYFPRDKPAEIEEGALIADGDRYNVLQRENYLSAEEYGIEQRGGCCMQLGHTMLRVLRLMRRDLCSTICEFVIPILFIVGSVILWVIFGKESQSETRFYDPTTAVAIPVAINLLKQSFCSSTVDPVGPQSLQPCADMDAVYCPNGAGIPAGLCYNAEFSPTGPKEEPGSDSTPSSGSSSSPVDFSTVLNPMTATAPDLDSIIAFHWYAMDSALSRFSKPQLKGGRLMFAPKSQEVDALVDYLNQSSELFHLVYDGTYDVAEADSIVHNSKDGDEPIWGIVQVNSMTADNFDVSIRLNASATPSTADTINVWYLGGNSTGGNENYIFSGFATLQNTLSDYYISTILHETPPSPIVYVPMPTPAFSEYNFISVGGMVAPLIIVLGFLYPVSQMTKRIVVEKELRIREAMLIMGLSEAVMYLAWSLIYMVVYLVVCLIMSIILVFTYLPKTNFGYLFFMFLFFSYSAVTLSFCIASLFNKARLAALLAPLIYFVMAIPLFAMQSVGEGGKIGICILSPSALAVGVGLLFEHEMQGGAQAKDLNLEKDSPAILIVFIFLFCDILVYLLLTIYFDLVIPKQWGTTKNPLFFIIDPIKWLCRKCKCACCCCCKDDDEEEDVFADGRAEDGVFEPIENEESAPVRIMGLRKKFKRGGKTFIAVNNLYWSLKEGEISVLLGHNGAGKSTTMNLMTGMLAADSGDCIIYGRSIVKEQRKARQEIGLCPQHNILWPQLTVREHLEYYAAIKGLKKESRNNAVEVLLKGVDMEDKEFYRSAALSGGQKRKLSVGVSFVGGSRLVFLDEPTAGMDVGARRHTWGLLKKLSNRHTILLSTHFMDEADLLGNTVAIMSQGRLQCSGSNMFLKAQLGIGFIMTMSVVPHVQRPPIDSAIRKFVPDAEPLGSGAGEVAYRLPMDSKASFPDLLTSIEDSSAALGIKAYSLSATTLEEIFLQIAEKGHTHEEHDANVAAEGANAVWNVEIIEKRSKLLWTQFRAMIIKRFWNALRDIRTVFFQIICPVACVLLAMLLTLVKFWNTPKMTFNENIYREPVDIPISSCDGMMDTSQPFFPDAQMLSWSTSTPDAFENQLLSESHVNNRYGALQCGTFLSQQALFLFYNMSSYHEVPLETANYYNSYLSKVGLPRSLTLSNEPMPKTTQQEAMQTSMYALMIACIIMIPFTFIPSTFVGWIVKERECKARHLQNVSGLSFYIYWVSNFVFDLACYIITMFLVIAVFGIFQRKEYIEGVNLAATVVLFFMYGLSGILMAYAVNFIFNSHSTAQNVVMLANFIIGFLLVLAISALQMTDSTKDVAKVLRWIFRIVPSYCVGEGISNLATLQLERAFGSSKTAFHMDCIGWVCVYMAIEIPVFAFITLFVDHPGRRQRAQRMFHNPNGEPEVIDDEDPDVVAEREAVNSGERDGDLVSVHNLRKEYSNGKVAVRNITFGVKPGEVFGFLGTNGAGKTTTISILCQEFYPTAGHASICGHDIVSDSQSALRCIGYCPQFDACIDLLTVEEHLYLYAGVRGITSNTRENVVEGLLKLCELVNYRKTKSHELSGGNRRKLSVAISLIGGPRVVFLDEPSAGMDPVARRGLWTAIETVADNCSVVLTTHHLEEVEALAHRVAIMVDGILHCIGDKTHLKQKFGTGFEVTVRVPDDKSYVDDLEKFFDHEFPSSEALENRAGRLTFQLPNTVRLSTVFTLLEEHKERLSIIDYNVSQTSIEQVFMRISEEAEAKQEAEFHEKNNEKKGCCGCCC